MAKKIYISGKITGLPYNDAFELFEQAEKKIIENGNTSVNPMKLCGNNPDWSWEDYMEKDLGALLRCDGIYFLSNWRDSKGARVEFAVAKELQLEMFME